ncbi:regulator of volume decrease after cellular swelling-domain-containing protein [Pseudomassariella vexata]|uniref:Regulator of volume decrease after cellular swelling-domain-containing protein n=1 Tax=Pseudomassariella vexata TaxID=1141098 RepID=A0A1Y2EHP9_9PEZI|nr:regulator of volume decrease after cellular swelling-domain-containing protein [Pseudomassariella vexata]ORY71101.1 regulator of volume decrease after cellular swelling-domain-containing protein [Pseudomassariella vexata]
MLPSVINSCPSADDDFEQLAEYQEQTPETFFDGKPVLYFHDTRIKAWCPAEQYDQLHFFSQNTASSRNQPSPPESAALENDGGKHIREERVEVFVGSSKLIIFSHNSGTGLEIPYPSITLHAIKNFRHLEHPDDASHKFLGVYLQLEFSGDGGDDDDSFDPIELTLVPSQAASEGSTNIDPLNPERTSALYNQISACSNLNPDPANEEDDEDAYMQDRIIFEGEALEGLPGAFRGDDSGGLPPPMPGSSGWITAENVHQYFDAEGNWIGQGENSVSGELGEGAGRVRARDEVEEDGVNGHEDDENAEAKRPRTD